MNSDVGSAVAVARMGHDAYRLEQAPLLQHRPRSPHDAPHDRVAPLREHRKVGEEVRPQTRAEVVVSRPDNFPGREAGVRAHVAKYAVLARRRQRVAKQAPAVRVVDRPRPRVGQVLDRLLAHPLAAVERRPQHLRRALGEGGKQVPQLHRLQLDRRRRAENDVRRISGDGSEKPEQVVWPRGFTSALASRASRLVRFVEDDDPEGLLRQRAALSLVVAVDDQARRNDADAPRALRDERRIALLGQRPALAIEPALLLGRPDRRRHAELVVQLVLPLPDQCRRREDQHRLVVEQRQHQRRRRHRERLAEADVVGEQVARLAVQPPIVDAGLDEPLLPRPQDLPALVDRPLGEHGVDGHVAVIPARLLDRAILDAVRHRRDMLDDRVGQVDALPPEMLEFFAHPFGRMGVVVAPKNFVGVAEGAGRVVHAADEGIDPSVGVLDDAGLAVDEDVLVVARHHAHLHAARGQQISACAHRPGSSEPRRCRRCRRASD